jgi:hypothetical protein
MKVKAMSKGMVVQLHLALVMAIDARLLVLDEPTLGLDILYRKQFYQNLLEDYFDENKTILITTHQIEEVEHILSDLMFIATARSLAASMDEVGERFTEVMVEPPASPPHRRCSPSTSAPCSARRSCCSTAYRAHSWPIWANCARRRGRSVRRHHERNLRMNTMKWLIKREMWENKGMLLWTPIVVAAVVAILAITSILLGKDASFAEAQEAFSIGTITIEGKARTVMIDTIAQGYIGPPCPYWPCSVCWCSSTAWARCMTNAATAACCSGNRCRFRIRPPWPPKPFSRWSWRR